jgi:hypothetical protein
VARSTVREVDGHAPAQIHLSGIRPNVPFTVETRRKLLRARPPTRIVPVDHGVYVNPKAERRHLAPGDDARPGEARLVCGKQRES